MAMARLARSNKKSQPVTRAQVLDACREHFAQRWGRSFSEYDAGYLAVLGPRPTTANPDRTTAKRYRGLRDAHLAAIRDVLSRDPVLDGRHADVLRVFLPALDAIMERMARVLDAAPAQRLDGWQIWFTRAGERFRDHNPIRPTDWAVLRILSGHWDGITRPDNFATPTAAIAAAAKHVRDALRSRKNRAE
jgi:hypothetical protein